jgi:hypothetical protein
MPAEIFTRAAGIAETAAGASLRAEVVAVAVSLIQC